MSILRVSGDRIVDSNGIPLILRGSGLGGWINMEKYPEFLGLILVSFLDTQDMKFLVEKL